MVSGKSSKAVRNARAAVVTRRSTPWGTIVAVAVIVLVAAAFIGYPLYVGQQRGEFEEALAPFTPTADNQDRQIEGIEVVTFQGGATQHVTREQRVAYTHTPPIGGVHDFYWAACNGIVYPEAVRSENLVHSLEHGAVWIAYDPDQLDDAGVEALAARVAGQPFMVMSPYPGMETPISLQSWGHQLKLSDPNDVRIDQFIQALRRNQYTVPEPQGTCNVNDPDAFDVDNPPPFVPAPPVSEIDGQTVVPEVLGEPAPAN
jgi:hypothetical protein